MENVEQHGTGMAAGASPSLPVQGFQVPTRDQARQKRQQEEQGFWFPLPHTGGAARVRIPSIVDRATIKALPASLQEKFAQALNRGRTISKGATFDQTMQELGDAELMANAMCVLAFIQPRLVPTEADLDPDDPYCMVVTDLHIEERTAFFGLVMQPEGVEAKRLQPFRAGPVGAVSDQPGHQAAPAPQHVSGPAGGGV